MRVGVRRSIGTLLRFGLLSGAFAALGSSANRGAAATGTDNGSFRFLTKSIPVAGTNTESTRSWLRP
jgi:hypothetical protein